MYTRDDIQECVWKRGERSLISGGLMFQVCHMINYAEYNYAKDHEISHAILELCTRNTDVIIYSIAQKNRPLIHTRSKPVGFRKCSIDMELIWSENVFESGIHFKPKPWHENNDGGKSKFMVTSCFASNVCFLGLLQLFFWLVSGFNPLKTWCVWSIVQSQIGMNTVSLGGSPYES
jgi:hypothetical protein